MSSSSSPGQAQARSSGFPAMSGQGDSAVPCRAQGIHGFSGAGTSSGFIGCAPEASSAMANRQQSSTRVAALADVADFSMEHTLPSVALLITSGSHKQCDERLLAALRAPVAVQFRVEGCAFGQRVGRIEVLSRLEHAAAAIVQADLHLSRQNEYPLRLGRAVPLAPEADRAVAQLVAGGRQDL